jgi:hypothetical protein
LHTISGTLFLTIALASFTTLRQGNRKENRHTGAVDVGAEIGVLGCSVAAWRTLSLL